MNAQDLKYITELQELVTRLDYANRLAVLKKAKRLLRLQKKLAAQKNKPAK